MQTLRYLAFFTITACLAPSHLFASTNSAIQERERQRSLFVAAEKAIDIGDNLYYEHARSQLTDYPLLPYLDYQLTLKNLKQQTPEEIRGTLQSLSDTPLRSQLLNRWLSLLAEEGLWHSYLSFSESGGTISRQCNRLHALMRTGKRAQAFPEVPRIWLSGRSRPKACDPVFEAWIDAGELTDELVWQRISLAMDKGRTRLANYLKRFLDRQEAVWVTTWISLYQQPDKISRISLNPSHPMLDEMATQAVRRLAWRNADGAFDAWQRLNSKLQFNDWQHLQVARSLMGQLSRQETQLSSQQVTALLPKRYLHLDSTLAEKQLQYALHNGDWELVLLTVQGLPDKEQQEQRWRYWQARALLSLKQTEQGESILRGLAGDRSYYGFLAAQRLSLIHI